MIEPAGPSSRTDDARLELAVAAAAAERANKPRWLVMLGAAVLAIALIYLLVATSSRAKAFSKISAARASAQKVIDLKNQLEAENLKLARRGTLPNPRMGQQIEAYAVAASLALTGPVVDSTNAVNQKLGMQQHKYTAKAVNQDPIAILNWLANIQSTYDSTGLEIARLKLTPGGATAANTAGWNVDADFSRWEKTK